MINMTTYFLFGNPKKRVLNSKKEYIKLIKQYNGKSNIFRSVYDYHQLDKNYNYPRILENSVILDKIFIDFDNKITKNDEVIEVDSYENMLDMHYKLLDKDIKHSINYSGRGYHIFVYVDKRINIINKRSALRNFTFDYTNMSDRQVAGDLSRICRIPFSLNLRSKTFCVPLNETTIDKKYHIKQNNNLSIFKHHIFCTKFADLEKYDLPDEEIVNFNDFGEIDSEQFIENFDEDFIPKCFLDAMNAKNPSYFQRQLFFTYLHYSMVSMSDAIAIAKKKWSKKKFNHSINEEKQPQTLYRKNIKFPKHSTIFAQGLCRKCILK